MIYSMRLQRLFSSFEVSNIVRELEENNIRISRRTFVRFQGVMAGA